MKPKRKVSDAQRAKNNEYKRVNKDKIAITSAAYELRTRDARLVQMAEYRARPGFKDKMKVYLAEYYKTKQMSKVHFLREAKNVPCADRKQRYPYYVMDFDHVRGVKVGTLGQMRLNSWEKILAEVAKCDVVCTNCHRERTFQRKQDFSRLATPEAA